MHVDHVNMFSFSNNKPNISPLFLPCSTSAWQAEYFPPFPSMFSFPLIDHSDLSNHHDHPPNPDPLTTENNLTTSTTLINQSPQKTQPPRLTRPARLPEQSVHSDHPDHFDHFNHPNNPTMDSNLQNFVWNNNGQKKLSGTTICKQIWNNS